MTILERALLVLFTLAFSWFAYEIKGWADKDSVDERCGPDRQKICQCVPPGIDYG